MTKKRSPLNEHGFFTQSYEIPPTEFKSRADKQPFKIVNNYGDNPIISNFDAKPEDAPIKSDEDQPVKVTKVKSKAQKPQEISETELFGRMEARMKALREGNSIDDMSDDEYAKHSHDLSAAKTAYENFVKELELLEKKYDLYLTDYAVDVENATSDTMKFDKDDPLFWKNMLSAAKYAAGYRAEEAGKDINALIGRIVY